MTGNCKACRSYSSYKVCHERSALICSLQFLRLGGASVRFLVIHKSEQEGGGDHRKDKSYRKKDRAEFRVSCRIEVTVAHPVQCCRNGKRHYTKNRRFGVLACVSRADLTLHGVHLGEHPEDLGKLFALQVLNGFTKPISRAEQEKLADEFIEQLQIKTASKETPIKSLSGGNQQKVILARWLLTHPQYLILDEPTRGIDVGTKLEIQKLVLKLAEEGVSVTFISSEIEEMLSVCQRLIVMRDRKIVGELKDDLLRQDVIMQTIAGGKAQNG